MTLNLLIQLAAIDHDDPESIAEGVADFIVAAFPPDKVGEAVDRALKLPEPFESWDGAAVAWLYERILRAVPKALARDPDRIARRALRNAEGLSPREAKAVQRLLAVAGADVEMLSDVRALSRMNARELKRRDPVWLLKQAAKHIDNPEAAASVTRALAFLEA